jgi:hypothetical protein
MATDGGDPPPEPDGRPPEAPQVTHGLGPRHCGAVPLDPADRLYGELVVVLLSLLLAYVLYRRVEEPARHRLRALGPRLTGVPAALRRLRMPSAARMGRAPQFSVYGVQQQAPRVLV